MFNIVGWPDDFSVSFSKLGLEGTYEVTDLWSGEKEGTQDQALTAGYPGTRGKAGTFRQSGVNSGCCPSILLSFEIV